MLLEADENVWFGRLGVIDCWLVSKVVKVTSCDETVPTVVARSTGDEDISALGGWEGSVG